MVEIATRALAPSPPPLLTVHRIVDGEPPRYGVVRVVRQQRVDVDVDLADGVVRAVGVVVEHADLQRLVLELLVAHLAEEEEEEEDRLNDRASEVASGNTVMHHDSEV